MDKNASVKQSGKKVRKELSANQIMLAVIFLIVLAGFGYAVLGMYRNDMAGHIYKTQYNKAVILKDLFKDRLYDNLRKDFEIDLLNDIKIMMRDKAVQKIEILNQNGQVLASEEYKDWGSNSRFRSVSSLKTRARWEEKIFFDDKAKLIDYVNYIDRLIDPVTYTNTMEISNVNNDKLEITTNLVLSNVQITNDLYLRIALDKSPYNDQMRNMWINIAIQLSALVILTFTVIAGLMFLYFIRPVEKIRKELDTAIQMNGVGIDYNHKDEFTPLVKSINSLIDNTRQSAEKRDGILRNSMVVHGDLIKLINENINSAFIAVNDRNEVVHVSNKIKNPETYRIGSHILSTETGIFKDWAVPSVMEDNQELTAGDGTKIVIRLADGSTVSNGYIIILK